MKLFDRFEIVEPFPAVYVEQIDAVVISDLHLGLESLMVQAGTYMPKVQLEQLLADLQEIFDQVEPSRLIVCGDIKHEFSETSYGEREEVQEFIDFVSDQVDDILLVKGNHDNYLIYPVKEYDNVTLDDYFVIEDMCFIHGHELPEQLDAIGADYLIIGHEHPAIALTDEVGVTEKLSAFLYGDTTDGHHLLVLPAFSRLAEGSQVNQIKEHELLSPILKTRTDFSSLNAVGVDREAGLFEFTEIGKLRQ